MLKGHFSNDSNPRMLVPAEYLTPPDSGNKALTPDEESDANEKYLVISGEPPKLTPYRPIATIMA